MTISINNQYDKIPDEVVTVADLVRYKNIPEQGTAIAIGARLVARDKWDVTHLKEGDSLIIISAAFGG